jgi:hypothetical protein
MRSADADRRRPIRLGAELAITDALVVTAGGLAFRSGRLKHPNQAAPPPARFRHIWLPIFAVMMGAALASCGGGNLSSSSLQSTTCPGESVASNYGFGSGPAYLSGQTSWYAGGQAAILMVDPSYSGPLSMRAYPLGGDGRSKITFVEEDLSPVAAAGLAEKERQHATQVVSAQATAGGLALPAVKASGLWRAWFGRLSTTGPGCYAIRVDGNTFSEVIVVSVQGGPAPPG